MAGDVARITSRHRRALASRKFWTLLEPEKPAPARRPQTIDTEIRKLIRQMQSENIGWGAPRIQGEMLKLGIEIFSLDKDSPDTRAVEPPESGNIITFPCVGGLPNRYARVAA